MSLIYLASPYSKYPGGKHRAFDEVCWKAAELMEQGHTIFCPIAHSHPIEFYGMSSVKDGEFWLNQDFAVLQHCDEVWVYMMPGWQESFGVAREVEFAKEKGIPIKYLEYENEAVYS